jgi:antitoxin HicB
MKYEMVIRWSEEDNCYLVGFPDFPGQQWRTHGATYAEATTQGVEALESLILAYAESGEALPEPKSFCT